MPDNFEPACTALSRRQMLAASGTGLLAATAVAVPANASTGSTVRNRSKTPGAGNATPEQVHLVWGDDPATSVVVSWTCPDPAVRPRVRIGERVIRAQARGYTDEASGETRWTYHARVDRLRPGATYAYAATADNDRSRADPFSATFTTAPRGRAKFRFTSFGDLAVPGPQLVPGAAAAAYAAETVESFQPLFHLVNGDSCDTGAAARADAWGDFGDSVQTSAANRPWMPVPGTSAAAAPSYLTRYTLPDNDVPAFEGHWYSFRVGSVLVVALNGDDVAYQPASARGYSAGTQTRWLESVLAAARQDTSVDWIVVQVHQGACSSPASGPGLDPGIARQWLPLFDEYEVDLVMSGHNAGYERSFPVRGFDHDEAAAGIVRPRPVTTADSGVFDTSQGTVHLALGSGGAGAGPDAAWSARRDISGGHGIAVLDVDPGTEADGQTSITVSYYRTAGTGPGNPALEPAADVVAGDDAFADPVPLDTVPLGYGVPGDYSEFESFTLIRPRSDKRRWHARKSPAAVQA